MAVRTWRTVACAGWLAAPLFTGQGAIGQETTVPSRTHQARTVIDSLLPDILDRYTIADISLAIVDGDSIHSWGSTGPYDWASPRVDADEKIFYLASTGKLFTAVAVLQQVEAGGLTLDDDLRVRMPDIPALANSPWPVTLRDLLTHAGGFDERLIGYTAPPGAPPDRLGDYLVRRMPPVVREPGVRMEYSNHGFGLAGRSVEVASGRTFEAYLTEHVFRRVAPDDLAVRPLPEALESRLMTGYRWTGDPVQFMNGHVAPAGGTFGTALGVAQVIRSLLRAVRGGRGALLSPASAAAMFSTQRTHHPTLPGRGFAFWEDPIVGDRAYLIGGTAYGYASQVLVLPHHGFALVAMMNRQEPDALATLARQVVDRVFPSLAPAEAATVTEGPFDDFAGTYRWTRYGSRSVETVVRFFLEATVEVTSDGGLTLGGPVLPSSSWQYVGQDEFRRTDGGDRMLFLRDSNGAVDGLAFNGVVTMPVVLERVAGTDTLRFKAVLWATVLMGVLGLLLVAAGRAVRSRLRRIHVRRPGPYRLAIVGLVTASTTAVFYALTLTELTTRLVYGPTAALWLTFLFTYATALILLATLAVAGRTGLSGGTRLDSAVTVLSVAILALFLFEAAGLNLFSLRF